MTTSKTLFWLTLGLLLTAFGTHWNCTIEIGDDKKEGKKTDPAPSQEPGGCVLQNPSLTQGEPQPYEATIIIKVFPGNKHGEAGAFALVKELRRKRIRSYMYTTSNGCWLVSVGRFQTKGQALKTLQIIYEKGYGRAFLCKPSVDGYPKCEKKKKKI